jgi:hypothetical protein
MTYYIKLISLSVQKLSTSEKSVLVSQPQYMRRLLSIVKSKMQTSSIKSTLGVLSFLTGEFLHS